MRHGIRASATDLFSVAIAVFCIASCAGHAPTPPPSSPPARAIIATEGRVSLRTSAYVELHSWLAGAARLGEDILPELEPARRGYARSLREDDEDLLLERTTRALSACTDDRCSSTAVAAEGFGHSFERALPAFLDGPWLRRASVAWTAIESAHAALGATGAAAEALFARAASDVGVTWPDHAVPIDVVSNAPPLGRYALIPVALAGRGWCFARARTPGGQEPERIRRARILDCVLVHALLAIRSPELTGALRRTLVHALGAHDGERAWSLLVLHAVAAVVTGWEPRHRSVYRRSAEAADKRMLDWLTSEWRGGRSEGLEAFAVRYAARFREAHPGSE